MLSRAAPVAPSLPPTPGPQIQRLQEEQLEAIEALNARPDVLTPVASPSMAVDLAHLPIEASCFVVNRLVLHDNPFGWLSRKLQPVVGQCVGKTALTQILDVANGALIERGYISSRVLMPIQSMESGTLALQVVPGRVGEVKSPAPAIGWLRAALPTSHSALLNQRDIDQGLENLRRLHSQADAVFELAPSPAPGESDIVLRPGTGKRWQAVVGVDNAGLDATGKYQLSGAFTFDSPLHLYDQLQIIGATNANFNARDQGNRSVAANYSVPLGYALFSLSASRSRYKQTVAGFDAPIEYSGTQSQLQAGLSGVIYRSAQARTEVRADIFHKLSHNTIDGVDLPVQHRDVIGYELGVSHRHYVGHALFDVSLGWRASLPGLSRNPGTVIGAPEFSGATQIELASVRAHVPFALGGQALSYQFSWNAQHARTPLTPSDYFTIGTRYAVRGFDQQLTLAAQSGWAISNEIDWSIPTAMGTQALYVGVDAGRVRGAATEFLSGRTLVGAVLGVRGNLSTKRSPASLSYDVSLGWPVSMPDHFQRRSPTLLVQLSTLF